MAKPTYPVILASTSLTAGIVAAWPLNEGVGNARDVVGGAVLDCSGSGVSWNASPLGLKTVGSPSRASVATPSYLKLYPATQPSLNLFWMGAVLGSLGSVGGVAGVAETTGGTNDYNLYASGGKFGYGVNGHGYAGTLSFVNGTVYQAILRQTGGNIIGVVNASQDGAGTSSNLTGGIPYGASSVVFLGTFPGHDPDAANIRHDLLVIWNRDLSGGEQSAMLADPWQIFIPAPGGAALLPAM